MSGDVDFVTGAPVPGDLDVHWIHGSPSRRRNADPATVVGTGLSAVRSFFGLGERPHETVPFDLGGRVLEVTGIPGHHRTSIAVRDPWTGLLLTGDTVCRGRLYVEDYPAFTASLDRLVDIARDRRVTHVLGCHIEMTRTPGRDYPIGATYQPDEPPLQLTVEQLVAARDAAARAAGRGCTRSTTSWSCTAPGAATGCGTPSGTRPVRPGTSSSRYAASGGSHARTACGVCPVTSGSGGRYRQRPW